MQLSNVVFQKMTRNRLDISADVTLFLMTKVASPIRDEGWMPNYFVPTDYFIDWSEKAARCLIDDGRIRPDSSQPFPRNIETYFTQLGLHFPDAW